MATWTLTTINSSIEATLATATGLTTAQDIDELTENIPEMNMPLLMVYPEEVELAKGSGTMKNTFGSTPVQQHAPIYHADLYVSKVGGKPLKEAIPLLITTWDAVMDIFRAETERPFFDNSAIQSFHVTSKRSVLEYSNERYLGVRFVITIDI